MVGVCFALRSDGRVSKNIKLREESCFSHTFVMFLGREEGGSLDLVAFSMSSV